MKTKGLTLLVATSALVLAGCGGGGKNSSKNVSVELPSFDRETAQKFNGSLNLVGDPDAYRASFEALERWSVEHFLTGMTLYDNTQYVMYHPSVEKGSQTYIPAYGFGIQREGNLISDLEGESNAEYKRYYHSALQADPNTLKYMDSQENTVSGLKGNIAGTLWTNGLNETKDDYVWLPDMAKQDLPTPLGSDGAPAVDFDLNTKAKKYRVEVKVGDEWKYNTNSKNPAVSAYDGTGVALEDYITPYKIYYTKAFGLYRSAENLTGAGSMKGTSDYYNNNSAEGINESAWAKVGISCKNEDGHNYLFFEFNDDTTVQNARAYLATSMMAPIPMDFIKNTLGKGDMIAGVKLWGNYSTNYTDFTPLDTDLSTGVYTVSRWDKDQLIVFKRNPYYPKTQTFMDSEGKPVSREIYRIQGLHYNILPAMAQDPNAVFKEFLANKLHSASIPSDYLTQYLSDPRTTTVEGDTTYRLNLNTCTQEFWDYNFGIDGVAYQNAQDDYWECEPIMSNYYFDRGLNYAIDRVTLAGSLGCGPCCNFLSNAYTLGEGGDIWNHTDEHARANESLTKGTDGFGFNFEYAKECFRRAGKELIDAGTYKAGDKIELEVRWYSSSQFEKEGNPVKKMIEDAFNSCGNGLTLELKNAADDSDPYSVFDYLMKGQFDIAIGAISGMEWWPLEFCETLKSNNSTGYTLGFGCDTNKCDGTIILPLSFDDDYGMWYYDPENGTKYSFSFDALFNANSTGAVVADGCAVDCPWVCDGQDPVVVNDDGSWDITMYFVVDENSDYKCDVNAAVFYFYTLDAQEYAEEIVEFEKGEFVDPTTGNKWLTVTAHVGADLIAGAFPMWEYGEDYIANTGIDIYLDWYTKDGTAPFAEGIFMGTCAYPLFAE